MVATLFLTLSAVGSLPPLCHSAHGWDRIFESCAASAGRLDGHVATSLPIAVRAGWTCFVSLAFVT